MESLNRFGCALLAVLVSAGRHAVAGDELVFARNQPATLCIEVIGQLYNGTEELAGRGSGFFLNDQRSALTDNHVLPDLNLYKSVRINGKVRIDDDKPDVIVSLAIKGRDFVRDLALLEADAPVPSSYVVQGDSRKIRPGAHLIVLGCPLNFGPTMTGGMVGNTKDDPAGRWLFDAPINPGNSGGPVLTAGGELVGVAWGGIRKTADGAAIYGLNYVIPIHHAIDGVIREKSVKIYGAPSLLGDASSTAVIASAVTQSAPRSSRTASTAPVAASDRIRSRDTEATASVISSSAIRSTERPLLIPSAEIEPSSPVFAAPAQLGLVSGSLVKRISRAFEIRELKDDHASVAPSTERYSLRVSADVGYKFTGFEFGELSRNHGSPPLIELSPDAKELIVTFSLTSGPVFDRYRAWLDGTLVTRQMRD